MQHLLLMPRSGEISAEAVSLSTGVPHKGWVRYLRGQNNFKVFLKEGEVRLKVRVQGGGPEEAERATLLLSRPAGGHWNSENEEKNEDYPESESEGTESLVHCLRTEKGRGLGIAKFFIWRKWRRLIMLSRN